MRKSQRRRARDFNKSDVGKFVYVSYWHVWDYVIGLGSRPFTVRVLAITPTNGHLISNWKMAGAGLVREHGTQLDGSDEIHDTLPPAVLADCLAHGFDPMAAIAALNNGR